jgi:hypothetical protein
LLYLAVCEKTEVQEKNINQSKAIRRIFSIDFGW